MTAIGTGPGETYKALWKGQSLRLTLRKQWLEADLGGGKGTRYVASERIGLNRIKGEKDLHGGSGRKDTR